MITIPFSVFFFAMLIMVISLIGWIHSTTKSFSRCLEFYSKGDTAGYSRGCLATLAELRCRPVKKAKRK